jgi:hypothetical protein
VNAPAVPEIALSAAWHAGEIPGDLVTAAGEPVQVIHRGAWSHGHGPDFRDSLLLFGGRELRSGSIEMHLRTRGWAEHGHHLDPAYDSVILHVVVHHDGFETRRSDGALVPVVEFGALDPERIPEMAGWEWDRVGGNVCAEAICRDNPPAIRAILDQLGDIRLAGRSARIEARLAAEPPGDVLWAELLDGFGFSANRAPMRALAGLAPVARLESLLLATSAADRLAAARGLLLGIAGFLPLSPAEAHLGRLGSEDVRALEGAWQSWGASWHEVALPAALWTRARVRPANHPVARLLSAANVLHAGARRGGLLPTLLELLQDDALIERFRDLTGSAAPSRIGVDRAIDMAASGIIPFALALAAHSGDASLLDAGSAHWQRLPAPAANAVTRRAQRQVAGRAPLGHIGARGAQGLIHLDTTLCQPRRCFECPIAAQQITVKGR